MAAQDAHAAVHAGYAQRLAQSRARSREYTTWDASGVGGSAAAGALASILSTLEAYDPWSDEGEIAEHAALAGANGWSKSRFGIYGVTPCGTVARVVAAAAARGAAPAGKDAVVLGSSVGWVAFGLAFLLPSLRRTVGVEILARRHEVAEEARRACAPDLEIEFVSEDARTATGPLAGAALIWDSLGFGGGVRTEILAAAAALAPPGAVLVTYDALPSDASLRAWAPLGEGPVVLPNSWTPRQRYYLYALAGPGDAAVLAPTTDAALAALAASHRPRRSPGGGGGSAAPEADAAPFLAALAGTLGTDAVAAFL